MSKKQLAIHITRTSVSIAEVFISNHLLDWQKDFDLNETNAEGYRSQLTAIFNALQLGNDYQEYTLAWGTEKHALIPLNLYNNSNPNSLFKVLFGEEIETNSIDFNRLMELSMVEVFEIPIWVKSFFVPKFPTISLKHEHTMLLRAIFQKDTFYLKVVLSLMDGYFNICALQKGELIFSNSFDYQEAEDLIYHLMYVVEQEEFNQEKCKLELYYTSDKTKKIIEEARQFIQKTKNLDKVEILEPQSVLKIQTLCV